MSLEAWIRQGQLIDLRDPSSFHRKREAHILGAHKYSVSTTKSSIKALRKDKPVLLYENSRGNV